MIYLECIPWFLMFAAYYLDERSIGVSVLEVPGIICGLLYVAGVDEVLLVNG